MNLGLLQRCNRCEMDGNTLSGRAQPLRRNAEIFACFHAAFEYMDNRPRSRFKNTYRLHMYKQYDREYNNFTVLSKVDMCRLLNSFKQIIPFKFHFEDAGNEYILVLEAKGTGLQNKALLMLSRSLFEFPHNMCGADALKLRALGHLGDIDISSYSLIDLYLLCLSSTSFSRDESFIRHPCPTLLPLDFWRTNLNIVGPRRISELTPYKRYDVTMIPYPHTIEDIISEDGFNARVNTYTINLTNNLNA